MADTGKIAKNLERFAQAVAAHDRENPTHNAYGIGLAHFDMERLGFDEGEQILPGITIHADSDVTGNFRVLCDGEHDEGLSGVRGGGGRGDRDAVIPAGAPACLREYPPQSGRRRRLSRRRSAWAPRRARRSSRRAVRSSGTAPRAVRRRAGRTRDGVQLRRASGGDVALHRAAERGVCA